MREMIQNKEVCERLLHDIMEECRRVIYNVKGAVKREKKERNQGKVKKDFEKLQKLRTHLREELITLGRVSSECVIS